MTAKHGLFVPPADLVLVDEFKVDLGAGMTFATIEDHDGQPAFFITLRGRVNKSTERRELHVMISADHGYNLGDQIMTRLEEFLKAVKDETGG